MSGSQTKVNAAGPYKWDGSDWNFWSLAPVFTHRLETIKGCPRSFVWLYSPERKKFLHAVVSPMSPYVNAVHPKELVRA